jgi:hypothetical protein
MKRHFLLSAIAVAALLAIMWSLLASWAAAFPSRPDHYKATLFGVHHISDTTAKTTETRCVWRQRLDACAPAVGGEDNFAKVGRARWFVFGGLLFTILGVLAMRMRNAGIWIAAPFAVAALSVGAAITLIRSNVASGLAAFAGARVEMSGTGMTAAEIAAMLCLIAAVVAAIPAWTKTKVV